MPLKPDASAGTPATRALAEAGIAHVLHTYARDPWGPDGGEPTDPARDRVLVTRVADVDGELVVCVAPVDRRLDHALLAAAVGGTHAQPAEVGRVEEATGCPAGEASPVGLRRTLPVLVDEVVLAHPTVLVRGGRPRLGIELESEQLIEVAHARVARICRPG